MGEDEPGDWLTTHQAAVLVSRLCPEKPISARAFLSVIRAELDRDRTGRPRRHFHTSELMLWDPNDNPITARWFAHVDAVERFARNRQLGRPGLYGERLSLREAAEALGVSHEYVRQLILSGELPAEKDEYEYRIDPAAVEAYRARQDE
ncbi:MAG: helix-turn-helix domain-containing protein [Anaerolineae bacterium]|nr:helix-turn-helix domain-containing protein [Anaerolineae bacterium]